MGGGTAGMAGSATTASPENVAPLESVPLNLIFLASPGTDPGDETALARVSVRSGALRGSGRGPPGGTMRRPGIAAGFRR